MEDSKGRWKTPDASWPDMEEVEEDEVCFVNMVRAAYRQGRVSSMESCV
jgi:hypothetical protein